MKHDSVVAILQRKRMLQFVLFALIILKVLFICRLPPMKTISDNHGGCCIHQKHCYADYVYLAIIPSRYLIALNS